MADTFYLGYAYGNSYWQEINPFELFYVIGEWGCRKEAKMEIKKSAGGMEQGLPRLQHWTQISGIIYR